MRVATRLSFNMRKRPGRTHDRPLFHERAARILTDSQPRVLRFPCVRRGRSAGLVVWRAGTVWHLIEDFFEQGLVVKLFLGVGWLAVVIMVASFLTLLFP